MKKYFKLLLMNSQNTIIYRVRALIWLLYDIIVPLLMIVFFKTIIQDPTQQIKGFTINNLITYYFLVSFFGYLLSSHIEDDIERAVKSGQVSHLLIKPVSFFKTEFAHELGYKSFTSIIIFILAFLLFIFLGQSLQFNLSFLLLPLLLIALALSFLINFLVSFLVGLLSFWLEEIVGLSSLKDVIVLIFSGAVLPLEFFPEFINKINNLLPFKYLLYFPVSILQGKIILPSILSGLLIQTIWLFIFYLLYKFFYLKTIKHYSAVGG
jgi:ABC-2 type transport system permease protein